MKSIVVYGSHFGNTRKIAEAIADALRSRGAVHVFSADEAPATLPQGTDLVLIGGPTEGHRMTEPVARFFARLTPGAVRGIAAAAFDTRLRWPHWLSGSAAAGIAKKLRQAGARVVVPEESFLVASTSSTSEDNGPGLYPGELERAAAWAAALADAMAPKASAAPVTMS